MVSFASLNDPSVTARRVTVFEAQGVIFMVTDTAHVRNLPIGEASSQLTALALQVSLQGDPSCTGQLVTGQSLPPGDQPQGSAVTLRYCSGVDE